MLDVSRFYNPSPIDIGKTKIEAIHAYKTSGGSATILVAGLPATPKGYTDLIHNVQIYAQPGSAQNVTSMVLSVNELESGRTLSYIYVNLTAGAANAILSAQMNVNEILLTESMQLSFVANFNAAVANNFVSVSITGLRIPRGNIQL